MGASAAGGTAHQRVLEQREQRRRGERRAREAAEQAQEHARRGERQRPAGAVVGDQAPAVELGGDAAGKGAVGGDEGGAFAVGGGTAKDERDGERLGAGVGGLDPVEAGAGVREGAGEGGAFGAPLVGDRRRAEGERDECVALRRRGRGRRPGRNGCRVEAEGIGEAAEAVLGMVGGAGLLGAQPVPDRGGQVVVIPGQHDRPLRQAGDGGHEGPGGPTRAGRAGDDDRVRGRSDRPVRGEDLGGGVQSPDGGGRRWMSASTSTAAA